MSYNFKEIWHSKILIGFLCISLFCSCAKIVDQTNIIIDTKIQIEEFTEIAQNPNVVSFLFIADTTTHYFKSYIEALSGKVSLRDSEGTLDFFAKGVYDKEIERLVYDGVKERETLCVICDTVNEIYYYRNIKVVPNLINLYLPLTMKMYAFKNGQNTVKEGVWVGKM